MRAARLFALCAAAASVARADEKEVILAVQPAFAVVSLHKSSLYDLQYAWGGGGGIDLTYGLTDAFAVRATGSLTAHSLDATKTDPGGTLYAWHAGAGATYAVESNLMEKVEGPHLPLASDTVTIPIKPYEILTLQVFYPANPPAAKASSM